MKRSALALSLLALALFAPIVACQRGEGPTAPAATTTRSVQANVEQALPYCYGSWRGTVAPFSHYTNLRLGGALAPGTTTAWITECTNRIKSARVWTTSICSGLAGSWTVQTHVGVRQCFNPDNLSTCLPEIGSGFATQCSNGVPVP